MLDYKNTFIGRNIKSDVLSGIVVAVALVPEAIGFSLLAGVSPTVGLYTAFILGLIAALVGGKPGMISGATGSVAVVLIALGVHIHEIIPADILHSMTKEQTSMYILQYILLCTIMAGVWQILIGLFKLGKFIRLVP